jgi:hypothetical protein
MKFKIGDRVKTKHGSGTIIHRQQTVYLVEHDEEIPIHGHGGHGIWTGKVDHCVWHSADYMKLISDDKDDVTLHELLINELKSELEIAIRIIKNLTGKTPFAYDAGLEAEEFLKRYENDTK